MVSMQLKLKQSEKYNGKRDFQVIDNWITSVDSYFTLIHAEAPDYLNTILTGEAAAWFRFVYRNINPSTLTWQPISIGNFLVWVLRVNWLAFCTANSTGMGLYGKHGILPVSGNKGSWAVQQARRYKARGRSMGFVVNMAKMV
jgi:hypothetical protein